MQDAGDTNAWVTLQPPFMVVFKACDHSCRMTHAINVKKFGSARVISLGGLISSCLWSLLLRHQGCAHACTCCLVSPSSFLSPFLLDCLRVCGLSLPPSSLPLCLTISLYHPHEGERVGPWRDGVWGMGMGMREEACKRARLDWGKWLFVTKRKGNI
jgi:hypothetical protein